MATDSPPLPCRCPLKFGFLRVLACWARHGCCPQSLMIRGVPLCGSSDSGLWTSTLGRGSSESSRTRTGRSLAYVLFRVAQVSPGSGDYVDMAPSPSCSSK